MDCSQHKQHWFNRQREIPTNLITAEDRLCSHHLNSHIQATGGGRVMDDGWKVHLTTNRSNLGLSMIAGNRLWWQPMSLYPSDWGWKRYNMNAWNVHWTTLPKANQVCREVLRCGCKKWCNDECKCVKATFQYTLWHCGLGSDLVFLLKFDSYYTIMDGLLWI